MIANQLRNITSILKYGDFKSAEKIFLEQASEDIIQEYFDLFKKYKDRITDLNEKNIDWWAKNKTFKDFSEYIDKLKSTPSKSQQKKLKKMEGAELIAENKDWAIYEILTHEASKFYGSGTKWCITQENDQYFQDYFSKNRFFFAISKNLPDHLPYYKIAIQINNETGHKTYWDAEDKSHSNPPVPDVISPLPNFTPPSLNDEDILDRVCLRVLGHKTRKPEELKQIVLEDKKNLPKGVQDLILNQMSQEDLYDLVIKDGDMLPLENITDKEILEKILHRSLYCDHAWDIKNYIVDDKGLGDYEDILSFSMDKNKIRHALQNLTDEKKVALLEDNYYVRENVGGLLISTIKDQNLLHNFTSKNGEFNHLIKNKDLIIKLLLSNKEFNINVIKDWQEYLSVEDQMNIVYNSKNPDTQDEVAYHLKHVDALKKVIENNPKESYAEFAYLRLCRLKPANIAPFLSKYLNSNRYFVDSLVKGDSISLITTEALKERAIPTMHIKLQSFKAICQELYKRDEKEFLEDLSEKYKTSLTEHWVTETTREILDQDIGEI